jgi:hypothetical protein
MTSGEAEKLWDDAPISLLFIDAIHNYVNTMFDAATWGRHVIRGGLIAFHDTDSDAFAGTRRAVYKLAKRMSLYAHVHGMVILQN